MLDEKIIRVIIDETFYDEKCSKAQLVSIGEINVDNQYFVLNINYENEKYSLKYDFSKIGREKRITI